MGTVMSVLWDMMSYRLQFIRTDFFNDLTACSEGGRSKLLLKVGTYV